jgi:perosamine synthetase
LTGRLMTSDRIASTVVEAVRVAAGPAKAFVPLHETEFIGCEWDYVKNCIDTGWVSSVGSYVDRFEDDLAEMLGAGHAIAIVNGTAALHLCLLLASVQPGDEVMVPTLTFVATANAVAYCRAMPHFVDVEDATLGLDAAKLDAYLTDIVETRERKPVNKLTGRPIAAVVCMHSFGHPAALDAIAEVSARHGLTLIEDAAESLGSTYNGRHCGTFARLGALSFNGNKVVTTGGGGAILTGEAALAKRAKHLSTTAKQPHPYLYYHDEIGFNYRLPNLNAALGCAQLEMLPRFVSEKRALADRYAAAFADVKGARFFREPSNCRSNYWLQVILLDDDATTARRDAVLKQLNDAGYMSRPAWTLMHNLPPYAAAPRMPDLSVAERIERTLINVPSSPRLGRGHDA